MNTVYRKGANPKTFLAAYDRTLLQWGVSAESLYVPTQFGKTHVLAAGPAHGEPLVLFHGFGFSSTMWIENMKALSDTFRVYAVDFVGDINKSEMGAPIRNKQDCAAWFSELLNGLGLQRAHVGGHSYGGFVALVIASLLPDRVGKLLVLSPGASLQRQSKRFFMKCLLAGMMPSTKRLEKFMDDMTGKGNTVNRIVKDQFIAAMQNALPRVKLLASYLKDDELRRITSPVLLLIGDQEIQYDAKKAVRRAEKVFPRVEAHIIPQAGHGLPLEKPQTVNRLMISFLRGGSSGKESPVRMLS